MIGSSSTTMTVLLSIESSLSFYRGTGNSQANQPARAGSYAQLPFHPFRYRSYDAHAEAAAVFSVVDPGNSRTVVEHGEDDALAGYIFQLHRELRPEGRPEYVLEGVRDGFVHDQPDVHRHVHRETEAAAVHRDFHLGAQAFAKRDQRTDDILEIGARVHPVQGMVVAVHPVVH